MSDSTIGDDEVLYRRIPPGNDWFEPPDRISSLNFKLRRDERGLSVYRASVVSARQVLDKPGALPGSRVAQSTARQIRSAGDAKGVPLGLDLVAINDEDDPGHAEIRGTSLSQRRTSVARALKELFRLTQSSTDET